MKKIVYTAITLSVLLSTVITSSSEAGIYYLVRTETSDLYMYYSVSRNYIVYNNTTVNGHYIVIDGINVSLVDIYCNSSDKLVIKTGVGSVIHKFTTLHYLVFYNDELAIDLYYEYNSHILVEAVVQESSGDIVLEIVYVNSTIDLSSMHPLFSCILLRNNTTTASTYSHTRTRANTSVESTFTSSGESNTPIQHSSFYSSETSSSKTRGGSMVYGNHLLLVIGSITIIAALLTIYFYRKRIR